MRILVVGAGGVGAAIAAIASRRPFFDSFVLADLDPARAERGVVRLGDPRFTATTVDAADADAVASLARAHHSDLIVNACDPRFNPAIFRAAPDAHHPRHGDDPSHPHPKEPYAGR
jgi:saccharopine dehydrogenase-like NADP-dependent oxidoreductase